jgi:hypothetical protein
MIKIDQYHILIINEIKKRPTVKSKVLSRVSGHFWHGWVSPDFILHSNNIKWSMEELIKAGIIEFIPKMPMKVLKEVKIG